MPRYLLSTHSVAGATREPMTEEQMQKAWAPIQALEAEMKSAGAWVFSARLHDPDTATVVRVSGDEVVTMDGPFVEAKEHLAGFYIIEAADLDEALGGSLEPSRHHARLRMPDGAEALPVSRVAPEDPVFDDLANAHALDQCRFHLRHAPVSMPRPADILAMRSYRGYPDGISKTSVI